jgi:phage/plasmid-associated DNA primase
MSAPTADDGTLDEEFLARFVRFLGHERFCIKSVQTGVRGAQEKHFDLINGNKAVDYIRLRNGKRQLWVNVQKLKKDAKQYHAFDDVESYTNIFIDIDANKPDDKKDHAATKKERGFALAQLPTVQVWLDGKGFKPGLAFKSGNGAGLLLPIPPTPPTPEFIAKVAAFLKVVRREANVDVDTTTFDPPRVCGVLGTWNTKTEDEAEGRKNHLREAIGDIPTRDEDGRLLKYIERLEPDPEALRTWTEKFNAPTAEEEREDAEDEEILTHDHVDHDFVKAKLGTLLEADPKLQNLLDWTDEEKERHKNNRSDAEFGLVGKLTAAGFSDPQIGWVMTHVSKIGKWAEEGEHYQQATLRKIRAKDAEEAAEKEGDGGNGLALDDVTFIDDKAKRKFSPDKAARAILERYEVVSTPDEKIWVYQDGVFSPDGDYIIGKALDEAAGDLASIHMKRETLAKVRLRTREEYDIFDSDPCLFPVQNGVIDLRRGPDGFMPHSHEYRRTWKAPIIFDRKAVCPEIKKYLSTSLDEDGRKTLIDIMAAKLTAYNFPYFSPWVGRGRNGKRLATEIIRGIWGDPQITEVEVHKFHERRFDQIEVKGRHFIINNEVPRTATKGFDWVKKISGGDPITADVKGRDQVQFRPHAFLIYDCNNPPRIDDYTKAIEERIAPIWWNYSFVDKPDTTDPREKQRDPHLEGKITSPSELSGFLNVLLQEVPRLIKTRAIHRPGTGKELAASYDLKADHLAIFWDRVMIFEPGSVTSSTRAFEQYCELCRTVGVSPVSQIIFNRYGRKRGFRDGRPYFTDDDGNQVRARGWYDCTLDEEELEDLLQPNRPNRTDGTGRGRDLDRKNRHARTEGTDIHSFNTTIENRDNIENSCIDNHIGGDIDKKSVQPVPSSHDIDSSDKTRPKTAKTRPFLDVEGTDSEKPRIFGLSIPYYLDLGGGQLPTVKALMQDQKWPEDKAKMAIGMLEQQGYPRGFNCPD